MTMILKAILWLSVLTSIVLDTNYLDESPSQLFCDKLFSF